MINVCTYIYINVKSWFTSEAWIIDLVTILSHLKSTRGTSKDYTLRGWDIFVTVFYAYLSGTRPHNIIQSKLGIAGNKIYCIIITCMKFNKHSISTLFSFDSLSMKPYILMSLSHLSTQIISIVICHGIECVTILRIYWLLSTVFKYFLFPW